MLNAEWWRRLKLITRGIQKREDQKLLELLYNYDLSLVANSGLTEESFKKVQGTAQKAFKKILAVYRPWEESEAGHVDESQSDRDMQAFQAMVGDPTDPEFIRQAELALKAEEDEAKEEKRKQDEDASLTTEEFMTRRRAETTRLLEEIAKDQPKGS